MTPISSKISYLAIPVSIAIHFLLATSLLVSWFSRQSQVIPVTKSTLIEFDNEIPKSEMLVDPGVKSEKAGLNRGLQNQEALDEADQRLKFGENYQSAGLSDPNLQINSTKPESDSRQEELMKAETKNVESVKSNDEEIAELHETSEVRPKSSYTRMFKSKEEIGRKNIESSSGKNGSFTLSSYEWEYAPYMYEWIEKIKNNWVEPISYLAGKGRGGRVIVKVTVSKSGKKVGVNLIYSNVNDEMTSEAIKAVNKAFDLPALPDSFKENTLEATFNMIYPTF